MAYIVKPLVTEKVTDLTEKHNVFCFVVRPEANKLQIQNEVEALYNVKVVSVNTVNYAGKNKSRYTVTAGMPPQELQYLSRNSKSTMLPLTTMVKHLTLT